MTLTPSGFFHLRTPLLPAGVFDAVTEGGIAAFWRLTVRPDVAEAVYLASPQADPLGDRRQPTFVSLATTSSG